MTIENIYKEFLRSSGVATDSRHIRGGEIFFALSGENFDGNLFIDEALRKGCRFAVTDSQYMGDTEQLAVVPDVLETLQELALHHRKQWGGKVLAITGSNGKTTTKELLAAVLSERFSVHATRGNLNNHIGVPLSLLEIKEHDLAVIEMGANHAGEIAMLCTIAEPDAGIITNIGKAHLEGFGSLEGVKKAKGELYDHLAANNQTAIVDMSDPVLAAMAAERGLKIFSYGKGAGFDVEGEMHDQVADGVIEATFSIQEKQCEIHSSIFGTYNFKNMLAAAAAGAWFGVPVEDISRAIEAYQPENNRSQVVRGTSNTLILDAYNANPTSMAGALDAFEQVTHPHKMVIFGDMHELGSDESKEHELLLKRLADSNIERVILVGERFGMFRNVPEFPFSFFQNLDGCLSYLENDPPKNAMIMLKGSRKNSLEKATKILLDC